MASKSTNKLLDFRSSHIAFPTFHHNRLTNHHGSTYSVVGSSGRRLLYPAMAIAFIQEFASFHQLQNSRFVYSAFRHGLACMIRQPDITGETETAMNHACDTSLRLKA